MTQSYLSFLSFSDEIWKILFSMFADLDGHRASDTPPSTVPLNILVTSAWPDIVIIDDVFIQLIELFLCQF